MRATLLALLCLAPVASAQEESPFDLAFKRYRNESLRPVFKQSAQSEERVIPLRGLDKYDSPAAAEWLMADVLVKWKEGDVQREAVRVLTKFRRPGTVARMAEVWNRLGKKQLRAKTLSLLAFGNKSGDPATAVLKAAFAHKDPRIVAAACRAVGVGDNDVFKPQLREALNHKEPLVRADACYALAELFEVDTKPALFNRFCQDKSRFVRFRAWQALRKLEKDNRLPCDVQAWKGWWEENAMEEPDVWGKRFPGGSDKTKAGLWFGIPVLADRVIFVVDATQRMEQGWRIDPVKERKKPPAERTPNFFSVKTRYALGLAHLNRALKEMADKTQVAVTMYHDKASPPNHSVFPETRKWLKLSKRVRGQIDVHVKEYEPGGTSSMWEGLEAAFDLQASKKPVQQGVQMICFLTNGRPSGGQFKDRADRVSGEAWMRAQERGIVIHTVGLHNHAFALLQQMAKQSGGLYVHAQEEGDTVEPQDLAFWPDKKAAFEKARKKKK
ncbi:MAG: VWA domain-containing protein [Planctomycetota bacterium]